MKQEEIFREYESLPSEAQKQLIDFIAFLRTRYGRALSSRVSGKTKLANEKFIGMWQDRQEMQNSDTWVRRVREREWVRSGG